MRAVKLKGEALAVAFLALCKQEGIPEPIREFQFAQPRKWRFDYCWYPQSLALEVDGGLYVGGAHVRGARIEQTHEKENAAAARGWRVLHCSPAKLCTPATIEALRAALLWEAA